MTEKNKTAAVEKPPPDRDTPETGSHNGQVPTTKPIEVLIGQLGPKVIFGEPVQTGETTVIPVAEVRTGFGFGGGQGRRATRASEQATEEGGGTGGGAAARVIPRGYLHIAGTKVCYNPIVDVTRLALASMALAAWMTFVLSKAFQR